MNEFQFKAEVAELYGVNEAIFLHSLSFWLIKNRSNRINCHDGRYWSYDTYKAIAERFPFWTARQIERIVSNCEERGAIMVGNYNEDKTDRTKWYTLTGAAEAIYLPKTVDCISPNGEMPAPQEDAPNPPNGEMQFTKEGHPITQTVNCNKVTVTYSGIPPISPSMEKQKAEVNGLIAAFLVDRPQLADVMETFLENRAENKKAKDSPAAIKAVLSRLLKYSGGSADVMWDMLSLAASGHWITVYEPKEKRGAPPGGAEDGGWL